MKWLLSLALALLPATAFAQVITGTPRTIDGDTLDMDGFRIRLQGIDAPEAAQTCQREGTAWQCGQEAKALLATLIGEGPIDCEQKGWDDFGRIVAVCNAGRIDLADELAKSGMVVALPQYSTAYVDSETLARDNRIGIWASEFQMPAEYRAAHGHKDRRPDPPATAERTGPRSQPRASVYYRNCNEARAAGAAPLYRGEPGYRVEMDGDGDGVACEPYRGRR